jgi:hypothetical protein
MISGLITINEDAQSEDTDLPIIDVEKDFKEFCQIFELT